MSTSITETPAVTSPTTTSKVKPVTQAASEDAQASFLQLLVAQITNQTPDNTLDATQMITQFAQMNAALGLQKLSQSVNFQKLSTATTMLHQLVTLETRDDNNKSYRLTGEVTGIDYSDPTKEPMIIVDGQPYSLDSVRQVGT